MNRRGIRLGFAAALAGASLLAPAIASAAVITWNNTGGTGDGVTWDIATNQNWNNGAPTVYNDGDNVTLSDTNNAHYAITVSGSVAPATLTATNTAASYTVTVASGQNLTVNGLVTIGQTAVSSPTKVILNGGGNYVQSSSVSTDYLMVSPTNALSSAPVGTLDASGLTNFTYNDSASQVLIGVGARTLGNLLLPTSASSTSSITAAQFRIGDSVPLVGSTGNNGGTSVVTLGGGANTIDASTLLIGNGKASGVLQVLPNSTVTIAGTAGGASNATITVGKQSSATAGGGTSKLLLAGANATVQAGTVIDGDLAGATSAAAIGQITFDTGNFTVATSLQIGADTSGADTTGVSGTFTLGSATSASTGTLDVSGAFVVGNSTSTVATVKTDTAKFIMNSGTANVHTDITSTNAEPATTTVNSTISLFGGTLNMNGNQIGHVSGNNKAITTVNMPGSGQTATLSNLGGTGIDDAGLTMNGVGTLILAGTDTYTGITTVTSGTISLMGNYTRGGLFTVAANATLEGVGSTNGPVTVNSGGFLAPGDAIGTLGVGSATLGGTLEIALNDASTPNVDVLNDSGNLDISSPTSAVNFNVTGTPAQPAYIFVDYGSLTGSAFATVTNLPAGYTIDYDYQGNNDIALVAAPVPEPASLALLGLGAFGLLGRRRRRNGN